jgi:hypothetical protein
MATQGTLLYYSYVLWFHAACKFAAKKAIENARIITSPQWDEYELQKQALDPKFQRGEEVRLVEMVKFQEAVDAL